MSIWRILALIGGALAIGLLAANAFLLNDIRLALSGDAGSAIAVGVDWENQTRVAIDWENQGIVSIDLAEVTANADMYSDVPTGFLPVMSIWTEDDDGEAEHVGIPVNVQDSQLDVWVDGGSIDVNSGNVTVDGGWIYVDNFP